MNFSPNMIFLNRSFDKKRLKALLLWFRLNLSEGAALEAVEILQGLGFRSATQGAISLGLDDLKTPTSKGGRVFQAQLEVALAHHEHHRGNRTPVELFQHLVDTWHRTSQDLTAEVVQLFHSTERVNPVYMMAFSGARGNLSQVRQLVGMRGLMADPRGQIVGFPILSNFREGLTITEYFVSCYGARKGVVDTAIRTADAGYLTRRLADVSHHFVVRTTNCGTHRNICLRDIKEGQKTILPLASRLVGRVLGEDISFTSPSFTKGDALKSKILKKEGDLNKIEDFNQIAYRNQEITPDLASKLASQCLEVAVRSPLSCSLRWGVCQLCYGWGLSEGRRVTLGEAVGIIAAQSIGEPGTQLTLRTFHTGGVFSGDLLNEIRAPYGGTVFFPEPLQGLLIRTPHGQIAFLTKVSGKMVLFNASQMQRTTTGDLVKKVGEVDPKNKSLSFRTNHSLDVDLKYKEDYNQDQELKKEDNSFYNINKADSPSVKASLLAVQKYSEEKDSPNYNEKKASSQEKNQLKADTKHAFSLQSNTETKEFPLQPSTVIFVRQKEQVNHNQLLAEFSSSTLQPINDQIEVTQQVLSETAGQVWFKEIQYGNRKGPGSGSLGTHFSSQKLGGIWVLAGKPRSEILLNDRQRFPIRFDKNSTNSIKIFDFKSDLKKRKQKHDRCLSPKVIQNFFLNNFEDRRSNASFPIEDWNKMQNQSSLQQKRLKSYKISEINLYHDHYFLTYHYSLGYSQLLNFASNKENKITSIYFKDRKASQQSTNCAPINTSWNIQIGSGWRPRLILNKQKRGIFEKKKNIFLLPPSTSICCDKLALSPHRLIGTSKKLIRFLQPPVISTKSIAFLKFPRSYTWLPNSTLKTEKTKHQVIKVSCKSILWRSNSLEEIYGWRTHRYRSNLIESIFVNNDQITKEKMESPLVNDMPFFIAFGERNGIKSKILREKETTDKVHLLLGTHFKNGIKSDVIKDYNQIPVAWWLQKEWKTAPGMLLVESLFSNKKKTEGQFFWLSSNFIQQNESGGEINNQLRKSISFPNGITFGECEVDVINDYKQNYLPLYSIFDNPQSKEADQAKKIAFNVTKYCASKIFTGVGNKENCNQFQIEDFNENDGIKFIQKKGINAVVTPTGSRGKGSENVLILHHSLDFLFETRKSQNVPVIKKLIQTLNLNRRQYSATNRGIFSPVKQNYTFERFIASIDSKVSQFFSTSNAGDSSIERVKKTKNLLTFKSFWQPLSLNNYPNKISNKRDLQRRKDIQSKLCIKKCNTFVERSSTLSGNKKLRFVNNFIKRKGTKKTVLAQKPIWLSVHISNNNLSFINSVDHPCLVNGVDTARKSKIFSTSLINSTQRELKSKILNEKNDSNLDQHVVHTINLPIVSFPYIIPSRCEWFPKDFKKPYYFSRCGTPVQGKLLPLIRQSFWEEDFFNQTQKDSALGINEVDFILGVLGLDKQKKPGAISKSEFMEILKSSSNSRVNLLTLSNFLQLPNVIQNKLDINRVNNQNVDDQKIPTNLSKVNRIILERLNHLETLNKRKFIALNFPLKSSILNPHNLISLEARDKTHNLIKRLTAYLFNGVKHPKNFTLFTFISFSAVDKLNQFFVRVSDIHFIVSLPIKTITNPQGRYTFAHLKLPKDNVVVTSCVDKKYKLSTIPQKLWTGKIQHIKEILRDQKIFEKKSNLLLKSSILNQDNPQSCYYRLMQRVLEYPVERSSFNRWVTTKRKKLQYSPFSTNFVTLFETEKDVKHGARNTLPIRNKIWITSKKFTSFHSAIYLDWYAFPLRPYDFLPIFGSLYKALSTKNKPINSSIFSKSRPMLINEGERQISLKKATSFLTPLTRAMPYLGESDQITFATNDSSLLSSYQENITHVSTMQRVTVWQSSLLLNKEYFSRFFEFSKRMATSLRWHSLKSKIVIRRHQVNEGDSKISQSVPNSPRNSHLMTFGESNSKTVFPFFILPNEVTMKQKPYSSIYTQLTKSCKLTYLLDFLFAWKRRSLFKANRNRKQKTDRSPLFFASPMHTEGNVKVVDQNLLNNGRAIFNAITFTQLRWLLILTELRKRFGNLNEEETFFDYQGLLGYGNVNKVVESPSFTVGDVTFKDKEKNIKTKPSYLFPGQLVAYGEKIDQNIATTESGQILYVDSQRAILRKAQTVLIYSQAILSVLSGEWIKKGTPLMALSYQKLVTGDIVQGLPKIEQFFEAPLLRDGTFWSDSLQAKLNLFFQEHREKLPLAEAVRKGFSDIQRVLVEGVQRVYISQGVLIADKHLEVIVRQMTCKGRILYSGDTGFLRNELVALDKIESVNQVTYGQKALYHPQVRGITDASLESESFLSAASFQETTRVLSRDSVIGKTDLMRGLKERVIVGELIQAGTGLANNSVYNFLLD